MSFLLTYYKFMSTQCHAFAHTCDKEGVRNCQERKILTETEVVGVKEDNRLIRKCRKARVDASDDVRHPTVCFVLFGCLKSNLNEDDLLTVLRVFVEKRFKR